MNAIAARPIILSCVGKDTAKVQGTYKADVLLTDRGDTRPTNVELQS